MLAILRETLKELLRSKKAVALITGILASILARVGVDGDTGVQISTGIIALVSAYLLSQGLGADLGKEKAKLESTVVPNTEETKPEVTE